MLGVPPTPALLKLTLTLTSHLGQNDGLGEGEVGSFHRNLDLSSSSLARDLQMELIK